MSNKFRYHSIIIQVIKSHSTPNERKIEFVFPSRTNQGEFYPVRTRSVACDGRIVQVPHDADLKTILELDLAGFDCTDTWLPPRDTPMH